MHSPWWRGKEQSRASLFLISIGLGVLLCGFFSQSCMHEEIPLELFACQKFELCCVLLAEESMPQTFHEHAAVMENWKGRGGCRRQV